MHPIMYRRARRATIFTIPVIAMGMWSWSVLKLRRKPPQDVRFAVGSADDLLADQLKTGDVLLFNRCWTHMLPFGAILSEAKKKAFGTRFDHAGVVIADRFGTPHVAEVTYRGGVKLRRFDERVLHSKSSEIYVVPVKFECDDEMRAKVERHVKGMAYKNTKSMVFLEAVGLIKLLTNPFSVDERRAISPGEFRSALTNAATSDGDGDREDGGKSLDDSRSAWSSVTSLRKLLPFITFIDESVTASPAVQLVMSCLDRVGAVDASEVARWKPTQLLTPRDLEDGAVPLRNGVEFGELVPIRINN